MQAFPRQTQADPRTPFPDLASIISSHFTASSSTTTTDPTSTDTSDPTTDPPPSTETSTNSTTTSSTTETTSETTSKTHTSPPNSTDTTSFTSTTSPAPITPPPLAFTPTTTSSAFNATSSSVTANFTTFFTRIDGQDTTVTSQLPTALINLDPSAHQSNTHRTTVIAGTTTALFVFVLSILAAIFAYRRHCLRKTLAVSGKRKEGRGLLDGEDFDDDDVPPQMRSLNSHRHSLTRSTSPAPSLLKTRVAETGSIFREEVWPPPGFVDPISKRSSQVDLSKIVDDVMGPNPSAHERDITNATTTSTFSGFSTTSRSSSPSPFLATGNAQASSSSLVYNDPFGASSSQSFYSSSSLPPGASPPVQPGLRSPSIPTSSTSSFSPIFPQSSSSQLSGSSSNLSGLGSSVSAFAPFSTSAQLVPPARPLSGSTTPKKSSPLARALSDRDNFFSPGGPAPPE